MGGGCLPFALCMIECVCERVASRLFFLHRGDLWYEPVWVLLCVPLLSFPEHCDSSGKTHRANGRDKELLSHSFFFLFLYSPFFFLTCKVSIFVSWTET